MYSVYLGVEGQPGRTNLFQDYSTDRNPDGDVVTGAVQPFLDKLLLAMNAGSSALFDDFYLSKSGFKATVPRPFGYTVPVEPSPPLRTIQHSGPNVILTWPAGGSLLQASAVTGPWTTNTSASSPYTNSPSAAQTFYRVLVIR